jgi:putative endonuclease
MAVSYLQRRAVGDYGERLAVRELERQGLRVLDRNWRCREGEIDIVAWHRDVLVICEVKTRTSDRYGTAVEAITPEKAARLRRLGTAWAQAHALPGQRLRIDVMAVLVARRSQPVVTHYEGLA